MEILIGMVDVTGTHESRDIRKIETTGIVTTPTRPPKTTWGVIMQMTATTMTTPPMDTVQNIGTTEWDINKTTNITTTTPNITKTVTKATTDTTGDSGTTTCKLGTSMLPPQGATTLTTTHTTQPNIISGKII